MSANTNLLRMAEAALSPAQAYDFMRPMRNTWGYWRDPDRACLFLGRNAKVRALVWC